MERPIERQSTTGLVLNAGGARGAYQAGVLKKIGELKKFRRVSPFQIIAGASAGAINGTAVAAGTLDFYFATRVLARLWATIEMNEVFETSISSMAGIARTWIKDLSFGGMGAGGGNAQSLLDATPLRSLIDRHLNFHQIQNAIASDHLHSVAVTATDYFSGKSFTFIQGKSGHPTWQKSRRLAIPVEEIRTDHILASSAIPLVFQPVQVATPYGELYFGDGALRLVNPISPAIRLGANRILAIAIRSQQVSEDRDRRSFLDVGPKASGPVMRKPPVAQIIGVILNAIFLDHLDADLDHLARMNELIKRYQSLPGSENVESHVQEPIHYVEPFVIRPSADIAKIAEDYAHKMPRIMRYMLDGLGTAKAETSDLMSYLLFDAEYMQCLIELGYKDAQERIAEIEHFLVEGNNQQQASPVLAHRRSRR